MEAVAAHFVLACARPHTAGHTDTPWGGMVWRNAVSNTATYGTPGIAFMHARIPMRLAVDLQRAEDRSSPQWFRDDIVVDLCEATN